MGSVTHYEALGVSMDATEPEIRQAYLQLARQFHPDFHPIENGARASAERRMQRINEAWTVVSDPTQRERYDRSLSLRSDATEVSTSGIVRPSSQFTPYFAEDEDDDDSWRYEPDAFDPRTSVSRWLTFRPGVLGGLGMVLLVGALMVNVRALLAVAVACFIGSGLLFLGAPVVAMFKSQINENQASGRHR